MVFVGYTPAPQNVEFLLDGRRRLPHDNNQGKHNNNACIELGRFCVKYILCKVVVDERLIIRDG